MAHRAGMAAALVLSGASRPADVPADDGAPDYVLTDVTELLPPGLGLERGRDRAAVNGG
jgi:ribonucleotide monophosphatase NagD (HAD superfamily)